MLNHRLQVDDSFRIRTHQPSGTAKASGSGRCGFRHHHRDRVSTTAVRQNAPRGLRGSVGSTPGSPDLPRARRAPAQEAYHNAYPTIVDLVVGPGPEQGEQVLAARELLLSTGHDPEVVRRSKVSYR
jgi:hypothetical protein